LYIDLVVKACNQVVVALVIEAVAEAIVLGSKAGVAPDRVVEVLSGGLASSKAQEIKEPVSACSSDQVCG
jgi:2-hydroxy-3-oxopropionate reductase